MTHRCVYCGARVSWDGPAVFSLRIGRKGDAQVWLRWCMPCADADPLQHACAQADAADSDDAFVGAYLAIAERIARDEPLELRDRIDIRSDTRRLGLTLRGAGDAWGRLSRR